MVPGSTLRRGGIKFNRNFFFTQIYNNLNSLKKKVIKMLDFFIGKSMSIKCSIHINTTQLFYEMNLEIS